MRSLLLILMISLLLGDYLVQGQRFCYSCYSALGKKNPCEINVSQKTVTAIMCNAGYNVCMTMTDRNTVTRACALPNACTLLNNYTSLTLCTDNYCNGGQVHNLGILHKTPANPATMTFLIGIVLSSVHLY